MTSRQNAPKTARRTRGKRPRGPGARPDVPDAGVIVGESSFISYKGHRYRIVQTSEKDAYDPPDVPTRKGSTTEE